MTDEHARPRSDELEEVREHLADRGAGSTIASVMPVSTVIIGGIGTPGFTSVSNVPRHSPPRYFTAPISVIAQRGRRAARGLEVDDHEGDLVERRAEVGEACAGPVGSRCGEPFRHAAERYRTTFVAHEHLFGADRRPPHVRVGSGRWASATAALACGNLTRFDVVATRRTRAFHHFSVGGDLTVEDETVLDERVDTVECRWCGAAGERSRPDRAP